jgi:Peptidase family M1 domain
MKLLAVFLVVFAWVGAFSLDREAFTFTKYDLDVRIEPEQQRLSVRGSLTLRNESKTSQKNAALQISSSLTWRSIQADGKPLQFVSQTYTSDIDHTGELSEAIITLPTEVGPGNSVEFTVGYEGVIALDATRLTRIGMEKEKAVHTDWDQISRLSSAVRGAGNVVWYPVAMDAANLSEEGSLFEILGRWKTRESNAAMHVKLSYSLSSEGRPPELICNAEGNRMFEAMGPQKVVAQCDFSPLGFQAPSFVMAEYAFLEAPQLQVFYRDEHKNRAEKFVQATAAAAPFVTEWVGAARHKVLVAELFDAGASPFESGLMLLTPLGDTDPKLLQIAMVHELTHAAFASNRLWVFEGLAHFMQAAYREQQQNRQAALDFLGLHRAAVMDAERATGSKSKDTPDEPLISTAVDSFYRSKAAYVWWMLRDMLGDDVLKKALANYRADQDKDPAYLQHLLETESKRNLQWFFDDWVYHDRGLPDFRVESAFPRQASQNNYLITVTVENLGAAGAEVPVTIHFDDAEITERVEVLGKAKAVVRVATPKPPTQVTVNDGSVPESDLTNNSFKVGAAR